MSPKIPKKQSCGGETPPQRGRCYWILLTNKLVQTFPESNFVSNLKKIGKQFYQDSCRELYN